MYRHGIGAAVVAAGAIFLAGCTHTHISNNEFARVETVEAIMSKTSPELEREFNDRTTYSLTMLQIMDAANNQSSEGRDMSKLLDDEIVRQFRARRGLVLRELREELYALDRLAIQAALREFTVPTTTYPRPWELRYSRTLSRNWRRAQCSALRQIPFIWAVRYPDRRLFSYKRFGITRAQQRSLCLRSD